MVGVVSGGPAPAAAHSSTPPADSTGRERIAEARQAAVVGRQDDRAARDDAAPKRPVAYGVKGSATAHEASAKYDARGKMRAEQDGHRGQRVDRHA